MRYSRAYQTYSLDEILFLIKETEDGKPVDVLSKYVHRSESGVKSKLGKLFGKDAVEQDGAGGLRGITQYDSLREVYASFGEVLPDGAEGEEDFNSRANNFSEHIRRKK